METVAVEPVKSAADINAEIDIDVINMSTDDIITRNRLLENDIRIMKSEILRLQHEASSMKERLQDNLEKIKLNKQLPYLVSNIVEILDVDPEGDADEEGANVDLDEARTGKCAVVKTSTRTVKIAIFPHIFFVDCLLTSCRLSGHKYTQTWRPSWS